MTARTHSSARNRESGLSGWPRVPARPPFWPIARTLLRIGDRARAALGVRRGVHAGGVYYKELSATPLRRALSKRGPGYKDFRVTFPPEPGAGGRSGGAASPSGNAAGSTAGAVGPDGRPVRAKVRVRCTARRVLADLMGPVAIARYARLESILKPGSRVLDVSVPPYITGYAADRLARGVGPSGAVVCLIDDRQALEFAERRYQRPNVAFEPLGEGVAASLAGEADDGFDAAIWLNVLADHPETHLKELLRVVRPGGWLVVGTHTLPRDEFAALLTSVGVTDQAKAAMEPEAEPRSSAGESDGADESAEAAEMADAGEAGLPPAFMFITDDEQPPHDALIRKPG